MHSPRSITEYFGLMPGTLQTASAGVPVLPSYRAYQAPGANLTGPSPRLPSSIAPTPRTRQAAGWGLPCTFREPLDPGRPLVDEPLAASQQHQPCGQSVGRLLTLAWGVAVSNSLRRALGASCLVCSPEREIERCGPQGIPLCVTVRPAANRVLRRPRTVKTGGLICRRWNQ